MMAKSLRALLSKLIKSYQLYISPMLGDHCRYYPSCSEYARQAIEAHGFFVGARLAIWRIMRCNPFSYGGVDHVPGCGHTSEDDSKVIAPQQSH